MQHGVSCQRANSNGDQQLKKTVEVTPFAWSHERNDSNRHEANEADDHDR